MNNYKKHNLKNRGMTYLEVVLAVAIIAYIVMAFAQVFIRNNVSLVQSKLQTLAHNWGAAKMEDIKTSYYSAISTGTWTNETAVLGKQKRFTRIVTVSMIASRLKEVEVKVTWTELNTNREIRVVSYVADYSK